MQQAAAYVADARDSLAKTGATPLAPPEFLDMIKVLATTGGNARQSDWRSSRNRRFTKAVPGIAEHEQALHLAADVLRILDALPGSEQPSACRAAGFVPIERLSKTTRSDYPTPSSNRSDGDREASSQKSPSENQATGFGPIFWRVTQDLPLPPAPRQQQLSPPG